MKIFDKEGNVSSGVARRNEEGFGKRKHPGKLNVKKRELEGVNVKVKCRWN